MAERHLAPTATVAEATRRLWRVEGESEGGGPLDLDRLIHERVRLGIVSALAVNGALSFSELKEILDATDGNLSTHARRLEEAGYIACSKAREGRASRTEFELTPQGRTEFESYLEHMEALIRAARSTGEEGGRR
ncbi:MAG: transcriptional regulator [Longimicrobiales bacterium]|nr:transcriptional regulator [Longimicrobiales bacterium]